MKLMVVAHYFYPKIGGIENYVYDLVNGLKAKYNWDIVVVTSNHKEKKNTIEILNRIKIYRLAFWFKLSNTPINPLWFYQLGKIVKKEKPDLINGHHPVPYITDLAAIISKIFNIPFILSYHNDLIKDNFFLNILFKIYYITIGNLVFLISKRIIVTSDYYAQKSPYLNKYLYKIDIVPPGVDLLRFRINKNIKINKKTNYKTVLFVGQLDKSHKHKGLSYLIEAIAKTSKKINNIQLNVVGKGDRINYYINYSKKLGVENEVKFLGFIPNETLSQYYMNSDLVVLPSYTNAEGFGIVLIEAGANKKPVIGSNIGGIPCIIDNGKNGILVPPKDPKVLADAIIEILKNPKLAKKMGENGYKKVKENFTCDIQVKKTKKIIEECLNKK